MGLIEDFVAGLPESDRAAVAHVYEVGRRVVPDAEEGVGYGVVCWRVRGKGLLGVKPAARHYALVPFSGDAIAAAGDAVAGLPATKGTIRFTPDAPLPDAAIEAVIRARLAEIDGSAAG